MYSAASRLSKLNEALVILSRIENRQFHTVADICVNDLVDSRLEGLEEVIEIKKITVQRNYVNRISTKMNQFLADILLENLIVNAIKHNHPGGHIRITTEDTHFSIVNTGEEPGNEPEKLFQRFVKANQKSHSLGLGLSIVKAICETYLLPIQYTFEQNLHKISVELKTKESLKN
jgi:signal transduction histidine kinase